MKRVLAALAVVWGLMAVPAAARAATYLYPSAARDIELALVVLHGDECRWLGFVGGGRG